MAEVRLRTTPPIFWFHCEGCGANIGHAELHQVHYEIHVDCYINSARLVEKARESGVGDIYTYLADRIDVRATIRADLFVLNAILLQNPPPG